MVQVKKEQLELKVLVVKMELKDKRVPQELEEVQDQQVQQDQQVLAVDSQQVQTHK